LLESTRSPALRVVVANALTSMPTSTSSALGDRRITTADGAALHIELLRTDVTEPSDLALAPDGRLFVAEAGGTIRIIDGTVTSQVAGSVNGRLLAIALDPAFGDTHELFALYASTERTPEPAFTIVRFREHQGRLGDRVVLLDAVSASADAHGTVRFGPDGKLYAAFDDADRSERSGDLSSMNGKVLRFEKDATTPADQDGLTPVFTHGLHAPRALAWAPATNELWAAEKTATGDDVVMAVRALAPKVGGSVRAAFRLPPPTNAAAMMFYKSRAIPQFTGNLLIASDIGEDLFRIQFDGSDPTRVVSTERLLRNQIGPLRAIAEAPDGAIYIATDNALWRLTP
jgi:glucose/arabinose dehydrogenase